MCHFKKRFDISPKRLSPGKGTKQCHIKIIAAFLSLATRAHLLRTILGQDLWTIVIVLTKLPPSPVILCIELGGKPKMASIEWGAVRITSLNPKFNGSHFGLPLNSTAWLHASVTSEKPIFIAPGCIHKNDWLVGNFPFTMTYAHGPHHGWHHVMRKWHSAINQIHAQRKKVWLIWWNCYDRSFLDKTPRSSMALSWKNS